jgi:hypothetical protein
MNTPEIEAAKKFRVCPADIKILLEMIDTA